MSRYMICDETAESQRIANLWQDVAESSSNPNAIFESAMLELYALGNSIEEEEIQSIKDIVGKLNVAAQLGQRDANFQLYRLHNTFRYANPRITELGSYVDAVGHLLRAVDPGSYMAAEELAAAYLSAKDAQNPASNGPEGVWREPSYGPLIDELGRRGMLPKNMAKGAELNLIQAASVGRWEAMEKLENGYERGTFGITDTIRALAWTIVRRLDGDVSARIPQIDRTKVKSVCEQLRGITRNGRIFEYHRPDWNALKSTNLGLKDCVIAPTVPQGNSCLHVNQLVQP
jgi:hypothetical protein